MSYTHAPWALIGKQGTAIWAGGDIIASMSFSRTNHKLARANAERIVTCVNGCHRINPESVVDMLIELQACESILAERLSVHLLDMERDERLESVRMTIAKAQSK